MGTDGSTVDPAEALAVFERQDRPGTPLTAPEVADALGCARRTAYEKLSRLSEEGALATKKVGARGRIWWRPARDRAGVPAGEADGPGGSAGEGKHGRALRELHDASRRLMRAETRETVCEVAADAARRILGLSLSGIWLYAPDRDVLEPVAWTEPGVEEYGEPPAFPVGESLAGRAFREGDYRAYDDITTEEGVYDPQTRVRSELILPLGGHGVLNASSPEVGAFDGIDVSLGRILAANVETALDRADRLEELRDRRRELERQRDELGTLNRINALVEDTIAALVGAATRGEIERIVCERLADSDFYADAWVVERGSSGEVTLRAAAGRDPDAVGPIAGPGGEGSGTVPAAIEDRTPTAIADLDAEGVAGRLRDAAAASGARSCLVVPLTYADTVFGALVVHAPSTDAFSGRERAAFETLGRVVGFSINATNNRRLLLGNTAVELEVAVRGEGAWFLAAAGRVGGTVAVEGLVPTDGGTLIEYASVEGAPDGAEPADLVEVPAVEDVRTLGDDGDRWFVECTVRGSGAGLGAIVEYGATIRTARAADGSGRVTARFPAASSAREAMAVVREAFPGAELVAKRVVDLSDRSVATVRQAIRDRLTDKQLTALRAAFLAGYYDSPRGTTARELAGSLGIAPSTLHQHLQAAHRKLLATAFDDLSAG